MEGGRGRGPGRGCGGVGWGEGLVALRASDQRSAEPDSWPALLKAGFCIQNIFFITLSTALSKNRLQGSTQPKQTQALFLQAFGKLGLSLWPHHSLSSTACQPAFSPRTEHVPPLWVSFQGRCHQRSFWFPLLWQAKPGMQRPSLLLKSLWFHDLGRAESPDVAWKVPQK